MPAASKVTARARLREGNNAQDFYVSEHFQDKLFCKACELTIDHTRPSSLGRHLQTGKHQNAARQKERRNQQGRRQLTINDTTTSAQHRTEITHDLIAMCTMADIPLHKADKMIPFIRKHARNGGAVPKEVCLRKYHLPQVYNEHITKLRNDINGKKVFIAVDETSDERDNSVLNIIVGK